MCVIRLLSDSHLDVVLKFLESELINIRIVFAYLHSANLTAYMALMIETDHRSVSFNLK